jgi:hypothetical protein
LFVRKAQGKKQTIVDQLYNLFSNFQKQISMNHTKQLKHTKYQVHQKPIFQDPINTTKLQLLTNSNSSKTDKNHCIIYPHFVFSSIIRPIQIHQQKIKKPFIFIIIFLFGNIIN